MAREIKFTPFGIPYILEFENVSFAPGRLHKQSSDSHPLASTEPLYSASCSSSTSSFCYVESPPTPPRGPSFSLRSASSFFKRKPGNHTSHIHSPSHHPISSGTSAEPAIEHSHWCDDTKPPPSHSDVSETDGIFIRFPPEHSHQQMSRRQRLVHLQQTISVAVLNAGMSSSPGNNAHPEKHPANGKAARGSRGHRTTDALFCGTYGQLMSALEGAGLSATSCARDSGQSGYTRLGALFVARNDGGSGLQLRKIALWG